MSTHVPDRTSAKTLLDAEALARTLSRIAHEIIERNDDLGRLALVGIHTRGVPLAERLSALIEERSGEEVALGAVDITFHRDDIAPGAEQPVVHANSLDVDLSGAKIVLVDDVLYTGRTARAALNAVCDLGRPSCARLAVLVDRGGREVPIQADVVGLRVPAEHRGRVRVRVKPVDPVDEVVRSAAG